MQVQTTLNIPIYIFYSSVRAQYYILQPYRPCQKKKWRYEMTGSFTAAPIFKTPAGFAKLKKNKKKKNGW